MGHSRSQNKLTKRLAHLIKNTVFNFVQFPSIPVTNKYIFFNGQKFFHFSMDDQSLVYIKLKSHFYKEKKKEKNEKNNQLMEQLPG